MDEMIQAEGRYFTGPDRVGLLGIEMLGWGHFGIDDTAFRPRKRTLDCFCITCLEKGSGFFESASVPRTRLEPGDMFILFPGEWHRFGPENGEYWQEYWFLFDGSTVRHMFDRGYLRTGSTLFRTGADGPLTEVFRESGRHAATAPEQLPHDLLRILGTVTGTVAADDSPLGTVRAGIEAHPEREWDFEAIAAGHGMSYSLFRKRFLKAVGMSPRRFVLSERVHKAKSLLTGGMQVNEAGRAVGIDDPYYFSRLFKKITGQAPRAFRDSIRSWKAGH